MLTCRTDSKMKRENFKEDIDKKHQAQDDEGKRERKNDDSPSAVGKCGLRPIGPGLNMPQERKTAAGQDLT